MIAADKELDVRQMECEEKFQNIFGAFDALEAGDSFVLINTFDPKPLKQQIEIRRGNGFSWEYLDNEPGYCRIRIGKTA
ncbi:DUF2249 domain-containing protein [Balneolales bacterium ANBcel1]|nr:DUF2249 domain-containing protein [Balneolales bacterium ANBcel1]